MLIFRASPGKHPAFEIQYSRFRMESVQLVVDNPQRALHGSLIVEKGSKASQVRAYFRMPNPEIEVEKLGVILLDNFGVARQPVARKLRTHIGPVLEKVVSFSIECELKMCWTIKACQLRIVHVGLNVAAGVHEPVVFDTMRRRSE